MAAPTDLSTRWWCTSCEEERDESDLVVKRECSRDSCGSEFSGTERNCPDCNSPFTRFIHCPGHNSAVTIEIQPAPILPRVRQDILPENGNYRDTGCHLHPSCLRCPRLLCIYDDPQINDRDLFIQERRAEIMRRLGAGEPVVHVAAQLGISTRTVHRTMQRNLESERSLADRSGQVDR